MSLNNNNDGSNRCIKQLQTLVNGITESDESSSRRLKRLQYLANQLMQSDKSSYSRNAVSGYSHHQSNKSRTAFSSCNSLNNNNNDSSSSLKQLQQLVHQPYRSGKSSDSRNSVSGSSHRKSNKSRTVSSSSKLPRSPSQLSNCPNVNNQILEVYTLPSCSNPQIHLTHTENKTPIWQTVAHLDNLLFQPENPSTNPLWPDGEPTSEVEIRKKRVICKCPNCNVEGGNKTYSPITGRLQHNCHIPGCGRSFDWPSILQVHLRAHRDDRPFPCSWYSCDKRFKSKEELLRHIKIHAGERNFICSHCNMGFIRKDHLRQHIYNAHEKRSQGEETHEE